MRDIDQVPARRHAAGRGRIRQQRRCSRPICRTPGLRRNATTVGERLRHRVTATGGCAGSGSDRSVQFDRLARSRPGQPGKAMDPPGCCCPGCRCPGGCCPGCRCLDVAVPAVAVIASAAKQSPGGCTPSWGLPRRCAPSNDSEPVAPRNGSESAERSPFLHSPVHPMALRSRLDSRERPAQC
jgi:hypothetical protein